VRPIRGCGVSQLVRHSSRSTCGLDAAAGAGAAIAEQALGDRPVLRALVPCPGPPAGEQGRPRLAGNGGLAQTIQFPEESDPHESS